MTVRKRLLLGFCAIVVVGMLALGGLYAGLSGVLENVRIAAERQAPATGSAYSLAIATQGAVLDAHRFSGAVDPEARRSFEEHVSQGLEHIGRYRSLATTDADREAAHAFEIRFHELADTGRRLIDDKLRAQELRSRLDEVMDGVADALLEGGLSVDRTVKLDASEALLSIRRWILSIRNDGRVGPGDGLTPGELTRLSVIFQATVDGSPAEGTDWHRRVSTLLGTARQLQDELFSVKAEQRRNGERLLKLQTELEREVREGWIETRTRQLQQASLHSNRLANRARQDTAVAIPLLLITFLVVGRSTLRAILRPLARLQQGTSAVEAGDLSFRIRLDSSSKDEFSEVLRRFNAMAERIQRTELMLRSVNERLQAENEQSIQAENALRRSESRTRELLRAIPDRMFLFDASGQLIQLGDRDEESTSPDRLPVWLHREIGDEAAEVIASGQQQTIERRVATPSEVRDLEVRLVRIGSDECLALVRDMTAAREVDRLKSEFVSTVSHELRTPLTSVRGSLGLLQGGVSGDIPEPAMELVRIALSNTERLIRLVNDMLDLEKIEAGRLELHPEPLSTEELVDEAVEGMIGAAALAGVSIQRHVMPTGVIAGDRDRLLQVLTNLLSNALKYSPGDGTVLLHAGPAENPDRVRFSVTDNGPGIPPEQRHRLFRRFQQLDGSDTRSKGGTGLGLAISRGIVELHGGLIDVDSEPGKGATFWFEIPLASARKRASPPLGPTEPQRVLVVEDDPDLGLLLDGSLQRIGFRVECTPSMVSAREFLARHKPDAIILDLELPDGTGMQLVDLMKANPKTADIPIIVITGTTDGPPPGLARMVFDWVEKPFSVSGLARTLRRAVRVPGPARVVLMDPDEATRSRLSGHLAALGAEYHLAANGSEAVEIARRVAPDLIVVHADESGADATAVVEALRWDRLRTTPLLVYSRREIEAEKRRDLVLGTTRYLHHSQWGEKDFEAAVRELLGEVLSPASLAS